MRQLLRAILVLFLVLFSLLLCASCSVVPGGEVVVSVADQRLALFKADKLVRKYPVSTSKFGLGDVPGSYRTPVGTLKVARKIGHGAKSGTVFKSRKKTGEVLSPNAPGRDPIVTRILWLEGTSPSTRRAFDRYIYIHGTPEERSLGSPTSYGCIRMASADIIDLFKRVSVGSPVVITTQDLKKVCQMRKSGT